MDKTKILLAIVIAMLLGGCGQMGGSSEEETEKTPAEMDPADLPQIDAFQSEYSREMMVSTEPVAEGYYLMRSKIDAFTIWFPEEAVFMDNASGVDGDHYEKLRITYEDKNENRGYTGNFQYQYGGNANKPERILDNLSWRWDYEDDWIEIQEDEGAIFYGTKEMAQNEYVVMGYKASKKQAPQVMEFVYDVSCIDNQADGCEIDLETETEFALEWVKSIQFSGTRGDGGETDGE